jgi:hypothetical protein
MAGNNFTGKAFLLAPSTRIFQLLLSVRYLHCNNHTFIHRNRGNLVRLDGVQLLLDQNVLPVFAYLFMILKWLTGLMLLGFIKDTAR